MNFCPEFPPPGAQWNSLRHVK